MAKETRLYEVHGRFYVDFVKVVRSTSENLRAIRKARDIILKRRKLRKKDFAKDECNVLEE
jgi:hypothetical protein